MSDDRYSCFNHERRTEIVSEYPVQIGWTEDGRRKMRMHRTEWIAIQCGHNLAHKDPKCEGCCWIGYVDKE